VGTTSLKRTRAVLVALSASTLCPSGALGVAAPPSANDVSACRALLGRTFGGGRVLGATAITPPYVAEYGKESVSVVHPFCLVEGRIEAEEGSEIGFEVWLPPADQWNQRFLATGSGGSFGDISFRSLARGVNRGFATSSSDDGHKQQRSGDNTWAYRRPARVRDFGHRAHHLTTLAAKAVIEAYYGRGVRYSYMWGYSRGGAQALAAAQRFPQDYDGILAGAPPVSWAREAAKQAWTIRAFSATPESALTPEQMDALSAAASRQCAGPDGLIADPRDCTFDPAALRCPGRDAGPCLSEAQIAAVRKVYAGPHTSSGERIFHGLARGSEFAWKTMYDVGALGVDRSGGSWLGVWRFLIFEDPAWTLERLDFDHDPAFAERKIGPLLTQDDPDLGAFARRASRLIVFQPWADEFVPPETVTDYHAAVVERMGREAADAVMRLFMIPGVDHRRRGPGAGLVVTDERTPVVPAEPGRDLLATLMRWVEEGVAPDRFVATKVDAGGKVERTRLLCPEPKVARHRGGDPLDAGNWSCAPR